MGRAAGPPRIGPRCTGAGGWPKALVPSQVIVPAWRQRLADETDSLWFRAVIEKYVLDRIVGGPQVMGAQPEHLLAPMKRDSLELHSCRSPWPFTTGSTVTSCCWISTKPSISFIERPTGAVYIQDQDQVGA